MSAQFSVADAEKKIEEIDFTRYVRQLVKEQNTSLDKLSLKMNGKRNALSRQLRHRKLGVALLYALSMHLKTNLFEPFSNQLPDHLRTTGREAALQAEIAALQKQLAEAIKERDIYKEVALRR